MKQEPLYACLGETTCADFNDKSKRVVVATWNPWQSKAYLHLFNTKDATLRWSVAVGDSRVTALCFYTTVIVAGTYDGTIRRFEPQDGEFLGDPLTQDSPVTGIRKLSKPYNLYTTGVGELNIWKFAKYHTEAKRFFSPCPNATALAALRGGPIGAGSAEGEIMAWDLQTGDDIVRSQVHHARVRSLRFMSATTMFSWADDYSFQSWVFKDGKLISSRSVSAYAEHAVITLSGELVSSTTFDGLTYIRVTTIGGYIVAEQMGAYGDVTGLYARDKDVWLVVRHGGPPMLIR